MEKTLKKEIKNIENKVILSIDVTKREESINIVIKTNGIIPIEDIRRFYRFDFMESLEKIKSITKEELIEKGYTKEKQQTLWIDIKDVSGAMGKKVETFCKKVEQYIKACF